MTLYSVVIPCYNRCALLAKAIDSVLRQNYDKIEIIVIDDGSTDSTAKMLANKYPQVRYFYQTNQGPACARNFGIKKSKGQIIAFLDSDDIWYDNKIRLELQMFQEHPEADLLAGNSRSFLEGRLRSENVFAQRNITFLNQQPRYFDWSMSIMKVGPVCCTSTMTFKRQTLMKLEQVFNECLRFDEDWDLEFRLFSRFTALLYPEVVCDSRIFNDGTRHFYSIRGQHKSVFEQRYIWLQQIDIISRYLSCLSWDFDTKQKFLLRKHQLSALLT